jgi:Sec-independent protein translocase protein TatA
MIVILGLIVLVGAVTVGVAGVLSNGGSGHALTPGFAVFGYHVTGSTGTLFLYGIVVGEVALAGLSLVLAGTRHISRRGRAARRGLKQARRETAAVSQDRDDLIAQRDTARAYTASVLRNGTHRSDPDPRAGGSHRNGLRLFGHLLARRPAVAGPPEAVTGQPAPDVPAGAPTQGTGSRRRGSRIARASLAITLQDCSRSRWQMLSRPEVRRWPG